MTRAINLAASEADVIAMCAKHKATLSCIETLTTGGTRVVLRTGHDAAVIAKAFGKKVITGAVGRTPLRLQHNHPPEEAASRPAPRTGWSG